MEDSPDVGPSTTSPRSERKSHTDLLMMLAAAQHGVVARRQLLRAGVPAHVIWHRLETGQLQLLHRGVYRVGPVEAPHARELAAVLACGTDAVLSHRSAGHLWRVLRAGLPGPIEVIVPASQRRRRTHIRVYRSGPLRVDEVMNHKGIPVTTPARTLFDLARVLSHRDLERALAEALALRLVNRRQLRRLLARHGSRGGARRLLALLERPVPPGSTLSPAEDRLLELLQKAQVPRPEVNGWVNGHRVDLIWRRERFIVEVDGYAFHSSKEKFGSDRRRDAELAAAGYHVVRVTWEQLKQEPEATLVHLVLALDRRGRDSGAVLAGSRSPAPAR